MGAQFSHYFGHVVERPELSCFSPPPRILVVEDDESIRGLGVKLLQRAGCRVDACEDGAAAWELIKLNHYDLLITDHQMPRVTGLELVEQLRSASITLPVILLSGALPAEELNQKPWLQIGAAINKPYLEDELLGAVEKLLPVTAHGPSPQDSSGAQQTIL
jgi:DNA-binding response OmpR family regulator